jgi:predicted DNA-binding transcriptional regulator AlpA
MNVEHDVTRNVSAFGQVEPTDPIYVNVKQCAARIGLSYWTLYHWIAEGKLTRERGLRYAGRSVRIEWRVFKSSLDRGELI